MPKKHLKVLFAASECAPIAKVGGLADVVGSLPKALRKLGVDVRIVIPKYSFIKEKLKLITNKIRVKKEKVSLFSGLLPETRIPFYLLKNKKYFSENGIYFERSAFVGSVKEIQRFLFFSQAVLETFRNLNWKPDIIHCHDWHTAIIPALLQTTSYKLQAKTLLTIHNLANQGKWRAKEVLDFLDFKKEEIGIKDERKRMNIFSQGILNADFLNTVSPTYSREILTKQYGAGLEKILQKRKKVLFGILNGIDVERFNPQTDSNLETNYSFSTFHKKQENKLNLQRILKLSKIQNPLFGFVGRLTYQKGVDLIKKIIPPLVNKNCQLVILGAGEKKYENSLLDLEKKYPKNVAVIIKFDPVLAQKIYGGADFFLMPSRFEPCGLGQMIAMRYGTLPIARKTGGLADTIEDRKTGFLFEKYNVKSFWQAIRKALLIYSDKRVFNLMRKQSMKKDFSWQNSAMKYLKLYNTLLK